MSFNKTFTLPFRYHVPNNSEFISRRFFNFAPKLKYLKRKAYLYLNNQKKLELDEILAHHQRILWINISAPSIGDSLMDLSSRIMIKDRDIDLFTDKKNYSIYLSDNVFSSVFKEYSEVTNKEYDLVIIDSFSTRSIKIKNQIAPKTPFVGMFGFYNGPEVNRVLFSFHRMNCLLGYVENEKELNSNAKTSLHISSVDKSKINELNILSNFIVIVVGGEWHYRTYRKWDEVINGLIPLNKEIILIGSHNGTENAKQIMRKFPYDNLKNFVSKLTFNQSAEIINLASCTICCDGGLMHAAHGVGARVVSLLARQDKTLYLKNNTCYLFDNLDVNNIPSHEIIKKFQDFSSFSYNHPQSE